MNALTIYKNFKMIVSRFFKRKIRKPKYSSVVMRGSLGDERFAVLHGEGFTISGPQEYTDAGLDSYSIDGHIYNRVNGEWVEG